MSHIKHKHADHAEMIAPGIVIAMNPSPYTVTKRPFTVKLTTNKMKTELK